MAMPVINEGGLSKLLVENADLRLVEPHVFSTCRDFNKKSSYDKKFGSLYDRIACNPLYNRIMWGYSTARYTSFTLDSLESSREGWVLDAGCGSLAFTAKTYVRYHERPVVLMDQSLKLIRIAKSRILRLKGKFPSNMVFVQGDALKLPFRGGTFDTVISLNLIHVVRDLVGLLSGIKKVLTENGRAFFTTLIKNNSVRDRYLELWENKGELFSREMDRIHQVFDEVGMPVRYDIHGSLAFIHFGQSLD
jgi:SAM-dependent methyltransferase